MGFPKALLHFRGETFADTLVRLFAATCDEVIVVLGYDADRIRAGIRREARFVVNPEPQLGQLSSLQTGLRAVSPDSVAVLFTPVDYPAIAPATVETLIQAYAPGVDAAVPRCRGRHGHPVLIAPSVAADILNLEPSRSARDVMHAIAASTCYLDVDDPGILRDVDDPAAYEALRQVRA